MVNDKLRELTEGDTDMMIELLGIFFTQQSEFMDKMREAATAEDWQAMAKIAHKFQPSTVYVGLTSIGDKLRSLADIGEADADTDADTTRNLFASIETELVEGCEELREGYQELVKQRDH